MPYHFELDGMNGILRLRYEGAITGETLKAGYRATPAVVQRISPRAIIIDLSQVTSFEVSPQIIRELARFEPTVRDPSIPRIIVAPSPYIYGMSRMFQIVGSESRPRLQVVQSEEAAYAELDVSQPRFAPLPEG